MEVERTMDNSAEKRNGFSISSIMGFQKKNVEQSRTDSSNERLNEKLDNDNHSSKQTTTLKSSEKVKKVKRLSNDIDSKRYRATFDKAQIFHMERVFLINHYPDVSARSELSKATGLSESQVQIWFQNRRAKWRKQQRKRRQDIPPIFGLGYPTHLARLYPGYDPYAMFPYEYYNTDFWTCAQQQIAAIHYNGFPPPPPHTTCISSPSRSLGSSSPVSSPVSSPGSPTNLDVGSSQSQEVSPVSKSDKEALEIRNDSSLLSLRVKAKEHLAALETRVTS
ncbi:homeobox protein ARX-like [Actinia tenebrosa]|uniref:Homeobox protein ARX-like n=1 Tax=Actinia tenebrosa TaxID=6105 RepID=A0A6P8INC6_ACTTE|nr:homeobox protein ARX-like [Actinia tenebrosa]